MYNFALSVSGAIMLLYRQLYMLNILMRPKNEHLRTLVRAVIFLQIFLETALHLLLLVSLLLERRWRFVITLWLYLGYRLTLLHTLMAALTVVFCIASPLPDAPDTQKHLLTLMGVLWTTWHATYKYVEADQKSRDNQRLADQLASYEAAPGGAPAGLVTNRDLADQVPDGPPNEASAEQIQVGLDPTGIYMLVPSHSEPRLSSVPCWEMDLDSWRTMANTSRNITTMSYHMGNFILSITGLGVRAETE